MKMPVRLLSLVLVLSIFFSGAVSAEVTLEDNPLTEWSTERLYSMIAWIEAEIARREDRDKKVEVPSGIYIVGYDIPIGTYTITSKDSFGYIQVHDQNDEYIFNSVPDEGEKIGKVDLKYGYIVTLKGLFVFEPYKGLGF